MTIHKVPVEHGEGRVGKLLKRDKRLTTYTHSPLISSKGWRWGHRDSVLGQKQAQTKTEALLQLANIFNQYY